MSINKVILTGNLTRDAEHRALPSGTSVLSFSLAVNDRRRDPSTGEWSDVPNYFDCNLFGSRANSLAQYLVKGTKLAIAGRLRWSQWEKDGQKRSKVDIVVDDLEFLSSRNNGNGGGAGGYSSDGAASTVPMASQIPSAPEITVYDDDIPF